MFICNDTISYEAKQSGICGNKRYVSLEEETPGHYQDAQIFHPTSNIQNPTKILLFSKNPVKIWLLPNEKPPVLMTVSALAHNGNRMVWDWSGQGNKMVWVCSGQYQYALNITSMLLIVPVLPIAYWYLTEHTGPKYKLGEYKIMTWP